MITDARLIRQVDAHPYRLLFATISGAHLYGFPSPDSDFDLRGVHVLPLRDVVGMHVSHETVEKSGIHDGLEIDLVTHDAKKFFGLMLKKTAGPEKGELKTADLDFHVREYERLRAELQTAFENSRLPEAPAGGAALNDLLVRIRMKTE